MEVSSSKIISLDESPDEKSYRIPFAALTTLFFMWGFITCMNDILIPYLKELYNLSYLRSMLIQFCFFGAYFTGSLIYFLIFRYKPHVINKVGYKKGMLLGLFIAAAACLLFFPAASYSSFEFFLSALFLLGLGFTLLQITANPYVSLMGSEKGASSRLNLAQAFNSLGTTIAPIIGGFLIFEYFVTEGDISADSMKKPYLIFALMFVLLALFLSRIKFPLVKSDELQTDSLGALKFPQLRLGIFAIFFYVGAEVAIGSLMINYLQQANIMNFSEGVAKNYLALYWGGAMIGRFLGSISLSDSISSKMKPVYMLLAALSVVALIFVIVDVAMASFKYYLLLIVVNFIGFYIGQAAPAKTLAVFASINIGLLLLSIFSTGSVSMWTLVGVGLFNSIMWSNIFTLSIAGLKNYTSQGSSLLVMAILGGAVIPLLQGALADTIGLQLSFFLPVLCYVYIFIFGLSRWKYAVNKKAPRAFTPH
jgi:FHS family L-fucose permease-like MFS transporter